MIKYQIPIKFQSQNSKQFWLLGHLSIHWSLVIGHWSFFKTRRRRKGSVLLLTLLILAILLAGGVSLSKLTIGDLKSGQAINAVIVAHAAAESAIESSLYEIRKATATLGVLNGLLPEAWLSNGANVSRTALADRTELRTTLLRDESVEFDVYNADTPLDPAPNELALSWTRIGPEWVEVRWSAWDSSGTIAGVAGERLLSSSSTPVVVKLDDACVRSSDSDSCAAFAPLGFRVRITARYDNLNDLVASVRRDGITKPLPGEIRLTGTGKFGSARASVTVTLPRRSPTSALVEPVLFTECSLVKGGGIVSECP